MKFNPIHLGAVCLMLITTTLQAATFYVDIGNPNPAPPFADWTTAATNIQDAIDAATNGDLVLVTNGVYATGGRIVYGTLTNRIALTKPVTVQSMSGPTVTTIQGYHLSPDATNFSSNVRCAYLTNAAVLNGFTIVGGGTLASGTDTTQLSGGGVYCESTNALMTNCILTGNLCTARFSQAGGGAVFQGTLNNCILSNNWVPTNVSSYSVSGGAAYKSVLNYCLIISNSASMGGGAAASTLNHCSVIGNAARTFGSTAAGGGTLQCIANYCLITGNSSMTIGGGDCFGILNNCLVISNYCDGSGGGVYATGTGQFSANCTIVGNTAIQRAGGVYVGVLKNCVVYGNYCPSIFSSTSNYYGATLSNSWTSDPMFINSAGGDYHLQSNSPCINAGNNAYVTNLNDLDGNPRIVGGTVDIGAYEFQSPSSTLSYAWAQQYNLATDGTADNTDNDGDGMNNWQEWKASTIPTNAASLLRLSSLSNSISGLQVTWQSVSGVTYFLQRSTNLSMQPAFSTIVSNRTGLVGTTSFTDSSATNENPYFYRVGVQ